MIEIIQIEVIESPTTGRKDIIVGLGADGKIYIWQVVDGERTWVLSQ